MKPITTEFIRKFAILILIALFAWIYHHTHLQNYSYIMLILALIAYLFGYKREIPKGAAYYSKIIVLDIMGYIYWLGAMMLFTSFIGGKDDHQILGTIFFFTLFGIVPIYLIWYSVKLSSRWYLFGKDTFEWSDTRGVHSIALSDLKLAKPYVKTKYPFSSSEMGIEIITKSDEKIKIMSNNLEADELFMKHLRDLYIEGDDSFAKYLKDEDSLDGDEVFSENLNELQERMEENGR